MKIFNVRIKRKKGEWIIQKCGLKWHCHQGKRFWGVLKAFIKREIKIKSVWLNGKGCSLRSCVFGGSTPLTDKKINRGRLE